DDDAHRIASARDSARQPRIVRYYRARADHDGVAFATPSMHQFARFARTDPSRIAAASGDSPVHRHRQLQYSQRPPQPHPRDKSFVQPQRFVLKHSGSDVDLRALEDRDSAPADTRVGIDASDDDALDACSDQRIRAWRRLSEMSAWLERNVRGRAARERTRLRERLRFRVRTSSDACDAA